MTIKSEGNRKLGMSEDGGKKGKEEVREISETRKWKSKTSRYSAKSNYQILINDFQFFIYLFIFLSSFC